MTVYLYIFGRIGGPFKVGYSWDPSRRAKEISWSATGWKHSGDSAVMWETFPLQDKPTAKSAERAVHRKLRDHQIMVEGQLNHRSEWFDAPMSVVRRAVTEIVQHHNVHPLAPANDEPDTEKPDRIWMVMPWTLVRKVDAWRGRQEDVPNRSKAIRLLIEHSLADQHPGS